MAWRHHDNRTDQHLESLPGSRQWGQQSRSVSQGKQQHTPEPLHWVLGLDQANSRCLVIFVVQRVTEQGIHIWKCTVTKWIASDIRTQFVTERLSTLQILRQFSSPLVGALQSSMEMACFTDVEKAKCMLHFEQNHSAPLVQWWFHTKCGKESPTRKSVYKCHKSFVETGCICAKRKNSGRRPSDETGSVIVYRLSLVRRDHKAVKQGIG
jgi:hypothetical protein